MKKTKKNPQKAPNKKKIIIISSICATAAVLLTLLILALSLGWFAPKTDENGVTKLDYTETNTDTKWEASYAYLDGRMKKEFKANGQSQTLIIEFETDKGEMDLMVYDKQTGVALDNVNHKNVGNGSFEFTFTKDAIVRLQAREHRGRFSIRIK